MRSRVITLMAGTDAELIARLKAGDSRAFDDVYAQFRARIFTFLARLTGQRALAEDLLQETFLRLVRFAPRLEPDTRLELWLYRVARNTCRSHYRWAFLDAERRVSAARATDAVQATPFDTTAARELVLRLEAALMQLPLAQRELLVLVAVECLPLADVAGLLGLRPDALRQRLSRARKLLAAALARDGVSHALSAHTGMVNDEP
ncbi:MAG: sigma-70 family RNA polymerase sigma factor [Polyangiales bacterium]